MAVACGDDQLSYRELNRGANRLAHHLRASEVGPEVRVALCNERSAAMVVELLAILKAGGAYIPLDPADPDQRLARMLAEAAPAVLLAPSAIAERLRRAGLKTIRPDAESAAIRRRPAENLAGADADHLAYVIYTSGSTGRPKGVQISHRSLVNLLRSMAREPGLTAGETLLALTTIAFDIAGLELSCRSFRAGG